MTQKTIKETEPHTNGTLCKVGIGKSIHSWYNELSSDCSTYHGYLGNSQVSVGTLGTP